MHALRHVFSPAMARHTGRLLLASRSLPIFLGFAWALAALAAFQVGQFFSTGRAEATALLNYLPWVWALVLPALTMHTWGEDARRGLLERYISLPISLTGLYTARLAVLWGVLGLWLLGTWPFVATLAWLGEPDWGALLAGYVGAFLVAGVLLSINLAVATLARSAVGSYLAGLAAGAVVLLAGWSALTDWLTGQVPGAITAFLQNISVLEHYRRFMVGLLSADGVVFMLGLVVLASGLGLASLSARLERPREAAMPLLAAALGLACMLLAPLVPGRMDATAGGSFTLHPTTRQLVQALPAGSSIILYASLTNPGVPGPTREVMRRVQDVLTDIAAASSGRLTVQTINPDTNVDDEVNAIQAGIEPQALGSGDDYLLGLVATVGGKQAVIPALTPQRLPYLEFDVLSLLTEAQKTGQKTLAVISSVALNTPGMQPRFLRDLEFSYNVVYMRPGEPQIPAGTAAVLVLFSPFLSEETLYSIDQFVVNGGQAMFVLDPFMRAAPGADELVDELKVPDRNADALAATDHPADLLRAWGVAYSGNDIVADAVRAVPVQQRELGFTTYPLWLALDSSHVNADLPFVSFIDNLLFSEAGAVAPLNVPPGLTYEPVVKSSASAGVVARARLDDTAPSLLAGKIIGPLAARDLGALLSGTFPSAFTGVPASVAQYYADYGEPVPPHVAQTAKPGRVLVLTDADFLADAFALNPQRDERGETIGWQPKNDNLVLAYNAVQYLAGDTALVNIRGKAVQTRRFARLDGWLAAKAAAYQKIESQYVAELFTVAQRLKELEARAAQGQATNAAQEAEQRTFAARELKLKKQLREVRKSLRQEIFRLERGLLLLNMLLMPLLTLAGLAYMRRRQRA